MESVKNATVFIAGATGGIGRNTARFLQQSGAKLILAARNRERLKEMQESLKLPDNQVCHLDLMDSEEIRTVAESVITTHGTPDIFINAAGIGILKPIVQLSEEEINQSIAVNLTGSMLLLKSFLPSMIEKNKGLIIHLPGVLSKISMAGASAYAASKWGLNGFLKSVREDVRRTEIRITNIYFGGTDTPFWDSIDMRVQRDKFVSAEDAARSIWFLCQQPASGVVSELVLQPFNHQAL